MPIRPAEHHNLAMCCVECRAVTEGAATEQRKAPSASTVGRGRPAMGQNNRRAIAGIQALPGTLIRGSEPGRHLRLSLKGRERDRRENNERDSQHARSSTQQFGTTG